MIWQEDWREEKILWQKLWGKSFPPFQAPSEKKHRKKQKENTNNIGLITGQITALIRYESENSYSTYPFLEVVHLLL
jgi:hypothetical protein